MTDRRTHRRIKPADNDDQKGQKEDSNEPSKQQYQVAKYLRFQCPTKQTPMEGRGVVVYFTGSKAVDTLLSSKWATNKGGQEPLFVNRESATRYLDELLRRDFFHRAKKITVKRIGGKDEAGGGSSQQQLSETETSPRTSPRAKDSSSKKSPKAEQQEDGASRRKKKIKLEFHSVQRFVDGKEAYVWLYEPTSISQIVYGSLIVLAAIGLCLFPLWPPIVRQGVYYLALTAASLIGFLFFLAGFRYVPFTIVWALTGGKMHFWLLPNLTQDVGFLESFVPVYDYEWKKKDGSEEDSSKTKKKGKKDKDKKSDDEDDDEDKSDDAATNKKKGRADKTNKQVVGSGDEDSAKPDTETEDDEENNNNADDDDDDNAEGRHTTAVTGTDQETLRGRSASPARSPSPPAKSPVSDEATELTALKVVADDSAVPENSATYAEQQQQHQPSGSSVDSSTSQEDFEMIERDDRLNAVGR